MIVPSASVSEMADFGDESPPPPSETAIALSIDALRTGSTRTDSPRDAVSVDEAEAGAEDLALSAAAFRRCGSCCFLRYSQRQSEKSKGNERATRPPFAILADIEHDAARSEPLRQQCASSRERAHLFSTGCCVMSLASSNSGIPTSATEQAHANSTTRQQCQNIEQS